jgi:hypothetical protein
MLSVTRNRTLAPMGKVLRAVSTWSNVPAGPPDPILGEFPASVPNASDSVLYRMANQYEFVRCHGSFQGRQRPEKNQPWCWGVSGW